MRRGTCEGVLTGFKRQTERLVQWSWCQFLCHGPHETNVTESATAQRLWPHQRPGHMRTLFHAWLPFVCLYEWVCECFFLWGPNTWVGSNFFFNCHITGHTFKTNHPMLDQATTHLPGCQVTNESNFSMTLWEPLCSEGKSKPSCTMKP